MNKTSIFKTGAVSSNNLAFHLEIKTMPVLICNTIDYSLYLFIAVYLFADLVYDSPWHPPDMGWLLGN